MKLKGRSETFIRNRTSKSSAASPSANSSTSENGQLEAILESTVDGIVTIDEYGIIQKFNRAAAKMFGYRSSEVLGRNVSMLMPLPFRSEHDRYISSYVRTGRAQIIGIGREVIGLRKDRSTFPIELAVSEVKTDGCRSFTGIMRDISDRKQLEKQIIEVSELEQQRIGRELHDGLCQELAGVAYLIKTIEQKLHAKEEVTNREVKSVAGLLQTTLRHARRLARSLHPVDSLPGGLVAALQHLAVDTAGTFGISCQFRHAGCDDIHDATLATHLYRIAQECVRDAAQCAKAQRIMVRLVHGQSGITLSISDNAARPKGNLTAFREIVMTVIQYRAHMVGGQIAIQPGASGGKRVTCQVCDHKGAYENE